MEPTVTVSPPPATAGHLHAIADSCGDDNSLHPSNRASTAIKLRLMCSSGGHIVPRPHDKSLLYVGGETRMVVVDRQTTLLDLTHRLSKTLLRSSSSSPVSSTAPPSFTLKYQLPSEDLDSLISVTTDEDLENMIEEYDRLNSSSAVSKSSRLRLFIFPTKPESASSIGSFLDNSSKSEDWFPNALNGNDSGFSDTSSVNRLLGLEDEISLPEKKDDIHKGIIGANLRGNDSGQDVHSIPDSPMMETTSSFGSTSSTPAPVVVSGSPVPEHSDPFLSEHERSDQGLQMAYLKHHHPQQHFQQNQSPNFDLASDDSVTSHWSKDRAAIPNDTTPDQNTRIQMKDLQPKPQTSSYLLPIQTPQFDNQHPELHQQQLEFIQTAVPPQQFIHHHHHRPSPVVPASSYYQVQMYPPMDHQNFVYYMPTTQPLQSYNFPLQQKQIHNPSQPVASASSGGGGGHYGYEFADSLQPEQQIYYPTQPMPPLLATQGQTMASTAAIKLSSQQQGRTAQP